MMRREQMLQRLFTILKLPAVRGDEIIEARVFRNRAQLEDTDDNMEVPALVLLDGSVQRVGPTTRAGGGRAPQLMMMTPQVFFVPRPTDNVSNVGIGEQVSEFEERIVRAVMQDGQLENLQGDNGYIEYRSMITDLQTGGEVQGQMQMDFAITFMFNPNKL